MHRLHRRTGATRARLGLGGVTLFLRLSRLCGVLLLAAASAGSSPRIRMRGFTPKKAAFQQAAPSVPAGPPHAWIAAAVANQDRILTDDEAAPLRYRVRKIDNKGDRTREEIESREGNVARLVQRDGGPLTAVEDSAERARLQEILASPGDFLERKQRSRVARGYARELVHALPQAMFWTYAPGQPQPGGGHGLQVVVDFAPDPRYKPPTVVTEALKGIAGRVWIDAQSHCVTRIEGRVLHPLDFGWGGLLARITEGGTVTFEQTAVGEHRWLASRLSEHVAIREVLVHTVKENVEMTAWDAHLLPSPLSYQDAIRALLAIPVPTR